MVRVGGGKDPRGSCRVPDQMPRLLYFRAASKKLSSSHPSSARESPAAGSPWQNCHHDACCGEPAGTVPSGTGQEMPHLSAPSGDGGRLVGAFAEDFLAVLSPDSYLIWPQ